MNNTDGCRIEIEALIPSNQTMSENGIAPALCSPLRTADQVMQAKIYICSAPLQ